MLYSLEIYLRLRHINCRYLLSFHKFKIFVTLNLIVTHNCILLDSKHGHQKLIYTDHQNLIVNRDTFVEASMLLCFSCYFSIFSLQNIFCKNIFSKHYIKLLYLKTFQMFTQAYLILYVFARKS